MKRRYELMLSGETVGIILDNWLENDYPFNMIVQHERKDGKMQIELDDLEYTCKLSKIYELEIREV